MVRHRPAAVALEFTSQTRTENNGARKGNHSADSMHYSGPGEIMKRGGLDIIQPTVWPQAQWPKMG